MRSPSSCPILSLHDEDLCYGSHLCQESDPLHPVVTSFLVRHPPPAVSAIEAPLEPILVRSVILCVVLLFPLNAVISTSFLLILMSYAIESFLLPISVNSALSSRLARSCNSCAPLHMTSNLLASCASGPMTAENKVSSANGFPNRPLSVRMSLIS